MKKILILIAMLCLLTGCFGNDNNFYQDEPFDDLFNDFSVDDLFENGIESSLFEM